jgi:hypothetical protein
MASYMFGQPIDAAAGDNQALAATLRAIQQKFDEHDSILGVGLNSDGTPISPILPPAAKLAVSGVDGRFIVDITNAQNIPPQTVDEMLRLMQTPNNQSNTPIYHRVQSALDLNWDANSGVTEYTDIGGSTVLHYDLRDPNVSKYWRIQSSYDRVSFNDWQVLLDAATCGNALVYSGLLKTTSLALLDSQAQTTDGSTALSQSGTTKQIDVAAKSWNVSNQVISYLGGSVTPATYGLWYVYGIDNKKAGGSITYLATQNVGDLAGQDGLIVFGNITTAAGGGGTGRGGGSCGMGGSLVAMYDGNSKPVEQVRQGDVLLGSDNGPEVAQCDTYPIPGQLCFKLTFQNGTIMRGVSSPDRLRLQNGGFVTVFDLLLGDVVMTKTGASALSAKEFIGMQTVYPLQLDRTQTYWLDGVATHNMKLA